MYKQFVKDRYQRYEVIPQWKGFVLRDFARNETIVAPIPFNLLFGAVHYMFMKVRDGFYMKYNKHEKLVRVFLGGKHDRRRSK